MSHIFISYSRKDLDFAQKIVIALAENDLDTWIDWKSIPKGEDWEKEIYRGIEEADAFLFLISPDSVTSKMCNKEIDHAVKNGKRILPILLRDADLKSIHPEISKRNWVFCRDGQDAFNQAIEEARRTIHTDYEWLKYHTELQVKALKWEQKQDASRLLRGKELREAEQELAAISNWKDPQPTKLQREYILSSQRNEIRTRRQITIGLAVGLGILLILSFVAWGQRTVAVHSQNTAVSESYARATAQREAEQQVAARATALINEQNARATAEAERKNAEYRLHLARAGELATFSELVRNTDLSLSTLLATESMKESSLSTNSVYSAAWQALLGCLPDQSLPGEYFPSGLGISANNRWLVLGGRDGFTYIWDLESGIPPQTSIQLVTGYQLGISPDSRWLAAGNLQLWDLEQIGTNDNPFYSLISSHSANGLEFSKNGRWVVTGIKNEVTFYDISEGNPDPIYREIEGEYIYSMSSSWDGNWLAVAGDDGKISIWDISTDEISSIPSMFLKRPHRIFSVEYSPDNRWLAAYNEGTIQLGHIIEIWKLPIKKADQPFYEIADRPASGGVIFASAVENSFVFSPDAKWLATSSSDGSLQLWDLQASEPFSDHIDLFAHTDGILSLLFSANGRWLMTNSIDGNFRIWDMTALQNSNPSLVIKGSTSSAEAIFDSSGDWLITAVSHGPVRFLPLQSEKMIELGCINARRNFTNAEWTQYFPGEPYRLTCPQYPAGE